MTTAQKLERTLRGKGYEGVSCTEWRKSIRLEGELDDWKAIVKAGKIARSEEHTSELQSR